MTPAEYAELILAAVEKRDLERVRELAERLAAASSDTDDLGSKRKERDAAERTADTDPRDATTNDAGETVISPNAFDALTQDQLVALQEKDPELYGRSLRFAAKHAKKAS